MTEKWTSPNIREAYLEALETSKAETNESFYELVFVNCAGTGIDCEAEKDPCQGEEFDPPPAAGQDSQPIAQVNPRQ